MGKKNTVKKNNKVTTNNKKQTKTTKEKLNTNVKLLEAKNELKKLSTILVVMIVMICILYIFTSIITKNNSKLKYIGNDEVSQISYTDILASDILKKDGSYYVLVKENDNPYVSLFQTYISTYEAKEESLPVYLVNLDDALNKNYKSEQSDFSTDMLKFKETTFLKVQDGKIASAYETSEEINNYMKELIKK